MPALAILMSQRRAQMEDFMRNIQVEGLIRLVERPNHNSGKIYYLPKEFLPGPLENADPYSSFEIVWTPNTLVRQDGKPLEIKSVYQPIIRRMPIGKGETFQNLADRISRDTKRLAGEISEENKLGVNAYHLGKLDLDYTLTKGAKESQALFGGGIQSLDDVERRAIFAVSFYEVK